MTYSSGGPAPSGSTRTVYTDGKLELIFGSKAYCADASNRDVDLLVDMLASPKLAGALTEAEKEHYELRYADVEEIVIEHAGRTISLPVRFIPENLRPFFLYVDDVFSRSLGSRYSNRLPSQRGGD